MAFTARNPAYEEMVRNSFAKQTVMQTLNAQLTKLELGLVEIELPYNQAFQQQHGFMHAGIITTVVDSACGYAAYTLMPEDAEVLTVEYKVNFLTPAVGDVFKAVGRVKRAGKTITVCEGEVLAQQATTLKPVATMLATMICLQH